MLVSSTKNFLILSTILSVAAGCTKNNPGLDKPQNSSDILSIRAVNPGKVVVVLTLSETPLLKAGNITTKGWSIPEGAKAKLVAQQAQVEQELKKISSDIYVLYRYRMTLNGLAIVADSSLLPKLANISGVKQSQMARPMERPLVQPVDGDTGGMDGAINSVNFLGVQKIRDELGFTGKGMRIGVIDTGIDYTHKMFGGSGMAEDYKSINPSQPSNLFPSAKVAGGFDFVGSDFDGASPLEKNSIPVPDANPLDEAGHGSHVGGTIAGLGDGVNSYTGVAPEAQLYALKVFGKGGATGDFAVVAALDFAADPNQDMNPDDQLHVVNLSLGGGFGAPQILYDEAVKNLTESGTFVVASAGNSGPQSYIVGAPSTASDALSVAATVDGSEFNWKFNAVRFVSPNNSNWLVKATDNLISQKISEIGDVQGELVDIGLANSELPQALKDKLKGNIALINRGGITFVQKLKFAKDNGAIGAVITNNATGAIEMGGDEKVEIPAISTSQELGQKLREEMKIGPVKMQFKTGEFIVEKEKIDTITEFSSKGPRSEDNLLKPEIAAPGKAILSAKMGSGSEAVRLDGTSMSSPHMSGIVALMKQAHPGLNDADIKAVLMNTAKPVSNAQGQLYPLTLQGAGRVQAYEAVKAKIVITPGGLSLGLIQVDKSRDVSKTIKVKNLSQEALSLSITSEAKAGLKIAAPASVELAPNETKELNIDFTISDGSDPMFSAELDGSLKFSANNVVVAQVPVLAVQKRLSKLAVESSTRSSGKLDFTLRNSGSTPGMALVFSLVGQDTRKDKGPEFQQWRSRSCDLESVGYRIFSKATKDGMKEYMQVAFKVYTPVTTWNLCNLSMMIDGDGDGVADQELASVGSGAIKGGSQGYGSVLLDAKKARDVRLKYEEQAKLGKKTDMDFAPAVISGERMAPFEQSTVAVLEVELAKLTVAKDGLVHVQFVSQNSDTDAVESDDYLGTGLADWLTISPKAADQAVTDAQEVYPVDAGGTLSVSLNTGRGKGDVVVYYPMNDLSIRKDDRDFGSETFDSVIPPWLSH